MWDTLITRTPPITLEMGVRGITETFKGKSKWNPDLNTYLFKTKKKETYGKILGTIIAVVPH